MIFTESGITIDSQDFATFRLENCKAFKELTGLGSFKEMDIGWYNTQNDVLYFVELKEFSQVSETDIVEKWLHELVKKTLDCFLMTIAIQFQTDFAKNDLTNCFNKIDLSRITKINFFHIICDNRLSDRRDYLIFLKDKVNERLSPYFTLFDKQGYKILILDCEKAKEKCGFVTNCKVC